jgi:hypothetical protein
MPIKDYNKKKKLEVSSTNDSGTTQDKAQAVLLVGGDDQTTGTGDIVIDFANISDEQDIAVYDQDGNLLNYEIEDLDTTAETGVIWCYNSWTRDDTVQAQIAYGDNSANTDRQNVTGTWDNSGQNWLFGYHLSNNPLSANDFTGSFDGNVSGTSALSNAVYAGGASSDGTDDYIDVPLANEEIWAGGTQGVVSGWIYVDSGSDLSGTIVDKEGSFRVKATSSDSTNFGIQVDLFGDNTGSQITEDLSPDTFYHVTSILDAVNNNVEVYVDGDFRYSYSSSATGGSSFEYSVGGNPIFSDRSLPGDFDQVGVIKGDIKSSHWIQADYDASPKAGQVYFSQQAAEATVTNQTVTVPETQTTSTNPDPQINATVDVSVPTSTATTVNPAPTVSPGAAPLNLTASTASTANPDFTVQPGNTTVQSPVSTATVSNPDPAVNAFNEITVPETTAVAVNPAPSLTVRQTILTPETTVASSNPDLTVQPGETSLNISTTQVSASNPVIGLNRQIVVGVATNLESENPEPNLQAGAVSVQVPETTNLTDNPALQLQPGVSRIQTEQATSLQTVNPDFNTVAGAAELQVSETQLTASIQEPSIGLTLQFVSPTNALITNDERFFDMPDHTFTEGDLGDTLTATLKDDASPDGVDLTGATEIRLVVKDRDGVKVFDKEMSLADSSNGDVEYKWSQGDFIEEPGVYRSKIKVFDSSGEPESFPNDGFRTIEVEEEIG